MNSNRASFIINKFKMANIRNLTQVFGMLHALLAKNMSKLLQKEFSYSAKPNIVLYLPEKINYCLSIFGNFRINKLS